MRWRLRVSRRWVLPAIMVSVVVVATGAGAAAAFETDTVESYWDGLWWAISLLTTVGFIGAPPKTGVGAWVSVVLMLSGFVLLSLLSAALASLFVREDEAPTRKQSQVDAEMVHDALRAIEARLERIEGSMPAEERPDPPDSND